MPMPSCSGFPPTAHQRCFPPKKSLVFVENHENNQLFPAFVEFIALIRHAQNVTKCDCKQCRFFAYFFETYNNASYPTPHIATTASFFQPEEGSEPELSPTEQSGQSQETRLFVYSDCMLDPEALFREANSALLVAPRGGRLLVCNAHGPMAVQMLCSVGICNHKIFTPPRPPPPPTSSMHPDFYFSFLLPQVGLIPIPLTLLDLCFVSPNRSFECSPGVVPTLEPPLFQPNDGCFSPTLAKRIRGDAWRLNIFLSSYPTLRPNSDQIQPGCSAEQESSRDETFFDRRRFPLVSRSQWHTFFTPRLTISKSKAT